MSNSSENLQGNSIVLIGQFDPNRAHPTELRKRGLITAEDLVDLKIEVILPEIVAISFAWIVLTVERNRFTVMTTLTNPMPEPVRDFAAEFLDKRDAESVTALGLNTDCHFHVAQADAWHRIGHILAPKDLVWDKVMENPGMQTLVVRGTRDDSWGGHVMVKVEPSVRIEQGVYVQINDHYTHKDISKSNQSDQIVSVLTEQWRESLRRADSIINAVSSI
jgi:hypothetical protein